MHFRDGLNDRVLSLFPACILATLFLAGNLTVRDAHGQVSQNSSPVQSAGLKGLLPADPPGELLTALERFPENWSTWTNSVVSDLTAFYGNTPTDIAAQRASINRLKVRLDTVNRSLADVQYQSIWNELKGLHGALTRRIAVLEAVLDTLSENQPTGFVDSARQRLSATLDSVDAYLDWAIGGSSWKTYLKTGEVRRSLSSATDNQTLLTILKRSRRNLRFARKSNAPAVHDFSGAPALKDYLRDIDRVVAAIERETSGVNWEATRVELKRLLEGLEAYEESKLLDAATQVRSTYDRLRDLAPDGGDRLTSILRQHYFNSNFQASFSEGLLNRFMAKTHVESGGVRDFILGADVFGGQTTSSNSSVDLVPAAAAAHFRIQLSGEVNSNTDAYASRAVISTVGNHQFFGSKDIFFDGAQFSTSPATLNVSASNTPVAASTKADGIPILGGIARRMALRGADRSRPESEAIAVDRVASRVEPRFDGDVDSAFSELNTKLRDKVIGPLQSERIYPDFKSAWTTDSELVFNSRLMSEGELGGGTAPLDPAGPEDLVFRLHDSLLNNAFDRLQIAGKTMDEPEFQRLINQKLKHLLPKQDIVKETGVKADTDAAEPKAITFADKDPLRVRFSNGTLNLIIRAGFKRDAEHGGDIPPQVLTIPWTFTLVGDEFVMTRGDISVEPVAATENVAQQVITAGVIKSRLSKSFPDNHKKARTFKVDDLEDVSLSFRIASMTLQDGWLSVRATAQPD